TQADIDAGAFENTATVTGTYSDAAGDPQEASADSLTGSDASGNPLPDPEPGPTVLVFRGGISGTVFLDVSGTGELDSTSRLLEGYPIELLDGTGNVIATTTTDSDGFYSFPDLLPGSDYEVVFRTPRGAVLDRQAVPVGGGQQVINVNKPIDPSGVIYDSITRAPVADVVIIIADASGTPLPAACVLPGQQAQLTGLNGAYRFDIIPDGAPQCPVAQTEYRLIVTGAPADYSTAPSVAIQPEPTLTVGSSPAGIMDISGVTGAPAIGQDTTYHLAFRIQGGPAASDDVINNNIPIDGPGALPPATDLQIVKTAGMGSVRIGDLLPYTITVTSSAAVETVVTVRDRLPEHFLYREGSAQVGGISVSPVVSGQTLFFEGLSIPAGGSITITLTTYVSSRVEPGTHVNRAQMFNAFTGAPIGPEATAAVRVEVDPVFQCSTVIGRVFDDINHDGYFNGEPLEERFAISDQDYIPGRGKFWSAPEPTAPRREKGLPGVRLVTPNGIAVTTDEHGRFSLPCAAIPRDIGSNFMLKLDDRTLPVGYRMTTENPRVVRLTPGMLTKMNFGAAMFPVARVDLSANAFTADGEMRAELRAGMHELVRQIAARPTVVRLSYQAVPDESERTANARLRAVEREIRRLWPGTGRYALTVERVVERLAQQPGRP
ncbi:MAG: DUF11 domain-containing protein, partial [Gammaproteobacteria bacterium]